MENKTLKEKRDIVFNDLTAALTRPSEKAALRAEIEGMPERELDRHRHIMKLSADPSVPSYVIAAAIAADTDDEFDQIKEQLKAE